MADSRLTTLLALPIAVLLTLGGAPLDARADICKKRKLNDGCVRSVDVKNQSLDLRELKDEAGFAAFREKSGASDDLNSSNRLMADAVLTAPRRGWAVVTATVELSTLSGKGSVRCKIVARQGEVIARKTFFDSLASDSGIEETSMSATVGFRVVKGRLKAELICSLLSGSGVNVPHVNGAIQYYPTRYKAP